MFNRNNLPSVPNPFGARPDPGARPSPRDGYGNPNQAAAPPRQAPQDIKIGGYEERRGYGGPKDYEASQRPPVGRQAPGSRMTGGGAGGRSWQLRPAKSPDNTYTFGNM